MRRRFVITVWSVVALSAFAGAARAEPVTFHVKSDESTVTFETSAVERIIGGTSEMQGDIVLDPEAPNDGAQGMIVISAKGLHSDNHRRDEHMHTEALESAAYPSITVSSTQVTTQAQHLADGEKATFTVTGNLDLHGQQHELSFPAEVRRVGNRLVVDGQTSLLMTNYGITPPSLLFLKVRDLTEVRFHIVAERN